ncbi:MAG TPA: hypothetical protein PLE45_06155, partial [Spirochaetota bacterium]|nr:hypothetical protein [Spirochaetota bacterium]
MFDNFLNESLENFDREILNENLAEDFSEKDTMHIINDEERSDYTLFAGKKDDEDEDFEDEDFEDEDFEDEDFEDEDFEDEDFEDEDFEDEDFEDEDFEDEDFEDEDF